MNSFAVLGSGRWGSFIAWYLNGIGNRVILWGRNIQKFKEQNENFDKKIEITSDLRLALNQDYIIISINSQNFRDFLSSVKEQNFDLGLKKIILCMKGIEQTSGKRLTEIFKEFFPLGENLAVWVGPGHVKSLTSGVPTCMVVDSDDNDFKLNLCEVLSSDLIKCFKGYDLIGTEIGAACKNVLGIASGILDALNMESLKGPLMSFGAFEVAKLIEIKGGKRESAFGLSHLGDFQATLFSHESNNRKFGESLVTGERFEFVAEGVGTLNAIHRICEIENLNLPICYEIYKIVNENKNPEESIEYLFSI